MREGRVRVNGVVAQLGDRPDFPPESRRKSTTTAAQSGWQPHRSAQQPAGVLCRTCHDPEGPHNRSDLLPGN